MSGCLRIWGESPCLVYFLKKLLQMIFMCSWGKTVRIFRGIRWEGQHRVCVLDARASLTRIECTRPGNGPGLDPPTWRPPLHCPLGLRRWGTARHQPGVLSQSQSPPDQHAAPHLTQCSLTTGRRRDSEKHCVQERWVSGAARVAGEQRNARRYKTPRIVFHGLVHCQYLFR